MLSPRLMRAIYGCCGRLAGLSWPTVRTSPRYRLRQTLAPCGESPCCGFSEWGKPWVLLRCYALQPCRLVVLGRGWSNRNTSSMIEMTVKNKTKKAPVSAVPEWVSTAEMATILGVSRDTLKTWRLGDRRGRSPKLVENVHWVAYSTRRVLFNLALMRDFMANIGRPKLHQKAIAAYLESLPSSKAVS